VPKLTVLVEKDENGKLWDYPLNQDEWRNLQQSLAASPLMIHKPLLDEITKKPVEKIQAEVVTIGGIPQMEEEVTVRTMKIKSRMPV